MLEAVPNVSEGRDPAAIRALGEAFADGEQVALLDVHADADHHRSVYTLAGADDALVDALLAGIRRALELVDLRLHDGVHPRVGSVDVVPLVPLVLTDMERARDAALALASRVADELELPVFLYGAVGAGRRPAFFRRGGLGELRRRVESGELAPDLGPSRLAPESGAVLIGARPPLVAYNLELATDDVTVATAIAAAVRESGGGLPGLQALGLALPRAGRVQVSMNVIDLDRAPLHEVVSAVGAEAAKRDVAVLAGELVGLVPERVLTEAAAAGVALPGVDETRVLERALERSRLGPWRG